MSEAERKEWIEDTVAQTMIMMKRKFNRPEMKEHTILNFLENNALVEFPGLAGKTQEELEEIT